MIISDFFLVTFALMNYAVFHVCITKPVGWRPTFKVRLIATEFQLRADLFIFKN